MNSFVFLAGVVGFAAGCVAMLAAALVAVYWRGQPEDESPGGAP